MTRFCILNILSDTRNTPKNDASENKGSQINLNSVTYSQITLCKKKKKKMDVKWAKTDF